MAVARINDSQSVTTVQHVYCTESSASVQGVALPLGGADSHSLSQRVLTTLSERDRALRSDARTVPLLYTYVLADKSSKVSSQLGAEKRPPVVMQDSYVARTEEIITDPRKKANNNY